MASFVPQIVCTACKQVRPGDDQPCPRCGAEPYPHRTDRKEFADWLEAIKERDRVRSD